MKIRIESHENDIAQSASLLLLEKIKNHTESRPFVLCLSTGASVLKICENLREYVHKQGCSLKNVVVFYAGGYIGFSKSSQAEYFLKIFNDFFSQVDFEDQNIFVPNGYAEDLNLEAQLYEEKIASYGGIDFFLGSLGSTGNLVFNEPGSSLKSRTRVKALMQETVEADSRFFGGDSPLVPRYAITVGVDTIFESKEILIVVTGLQKAFAMKACFESPVSSMNPASMLQFHPNTTFLVDSLAARMLDRTQISVE